MTKGRRHPGEMSLALHSCEFHWVKENRGQKAEVGGWRLK